MGIVAMIVALIFLTVGAGYLLWAFLSHVQEMDTPPHPKEAALLFLTITGLVIGTLAVLLVELQLLLTPASF